MFGMNMNTLLGLAVLVYAGIKAWPMVPAVFSGVSGWIKTRLAGGGTDTAAASPVVDSTAAFDAVTTLSTYLAKSQNEPGYKQVVAAVKALEPTA